MGILLRFTRASATAFWLSTAFFTSFHALGQATPGANPNSTLGQLAAAFSGGQVVQQIQLTGTATWTAGSLVDSGTAALTASTTGSSQMQLNLASTGQRTETQTGTGSSAVCQWAGSDGVAHQLSVESCASTVSVAELDWRCRSRCRYRRCKHEHLSSLARRAAC